MGLPVSASGSFQPECTCPPPPPPTPPTPSIFNRRRSGAAPGPAPGPPPAAQGKHGGHHRNDDDGKDGGGLIVLVVLFIGIGIATAISCYWCACCPWYKNRTRDHLAQVDIGAGVLTLPHGGDEPVTTAMVITEADAEGNPLTGGTPIVTGVPVVATAAFDPNEQAPPKYSALPE